MSVWLTTVAPALAGLFYLALGLAALARPATLLAGFGLVAEGVDARNEVRAVYGGFPLAVAGLVACSLLGAPHATGNLLSLAVASLGMALGRLVSAVLDRHIGRLPAMFAGFEVALALLLAAGAMAG
jgi:hypothetical protein